MKRAGLSLILIAVVLLAVGVIAEAQQPKKVPQIGYLTGASRPSMSARTEAFRQGLRELGYVEGKNIVIEWRFAEGNPDRTPTLAGRASASQGRRDRHRRFGSDPPRQGGNRYDSHCHGAGF